jgi:hypothetical protein
MDDVPEGIPVELVDHILSLHTPSTERMLIELKEEFVDDYVDGNYENLFDHVNYFKNIAFQRRDPNPEYEEELKAIREDVEHMSDETEYMQEIIRAGRPLTVEEDLEIEELAETNTMELVGAIDNILDLINR